jgi:hypothetical protein
MIKIFQSLNKKVKVCPNKQNQFSWFIHANNTIEGCLWAKSNNALNKTWLPFVIWVCTIQELNEMYCLKIFHSCSNFITTPHTSTNFETSCLIMLHFISKLLVSCSTTSFGTFKLKSCHAHTSKMHQFIEHCLCMDLAKSQVSFDKTYIPSWLKVFNFLTRGDFLRKFRDLGISLNGFFSM